MSPPGCPERDVVAISRRPGWHGAFLKLSCGHEQWLAGAESDFELRRGRRPCLSSPCYQFQTELGR